MQDRSVKVVYKTPNAVLVDIVKAERYEIQDAVLVLKRGDGTLAKLYSSGTWLTLESV